MNIKLEQLQKAIDSAAALADSAAEDDAYAEDDAALDAYWKAIQELKAYKKEHGL